MRAAIVPIFALICSARTPPDPLDAAHLEAVHAQRLQWMKQRVSRPLPGIYRDFRAVTTRDPGDWKDLAKSARDAEVDILWMSEPDRIRDGILIGPAPPDAPRFPDSDPAPDLTPKRRKLAAKQSKQYPDEVFAASGFGSPSAALHHASTHVLAGNLTPNEIRASLDQGHAYAARDWLCDPAGFFFIADTPLGVYDIGDTAPLLSGSRLEARLPIAAKLRLTRDGSLVEEIQASSLSYNVTEPGAYRLEASLTIEKTDRPWIYTNPIRVAKAAPIEIPVPADSPLVQQHKNIAYSAGRDLDLYLPADKKHFPVMVFLNGGGDRAMYAPLGQRFAREGIGVAIPERGPVEDAAAAFAWVFKNIEQYGGDPERIYIAGHSSGASLAALLALDPDYFGKFSVPWNAVRGVIALSGAYKDAVQHVHTKAPPFLIGYCQWDDFGLPLEARELAAALKKKFANVQAVYVPGENHISEIASLSGTGDPTARAILSFIK